MKVLLSFVLLLAAVTGFASDSPPAETHQVLYLADAGVVVLRLSVVVEGGKPEQCQEKFVDSLLKSLDKNGDGVVTVDEARATAEEEPLTLARIIHHEKHERRESEEEARVLIPSDRQGTTRDVLRCSDRNSLHFRVFRVFRGSS